MELTDMIPAWRTLSPDISHHIARDAICHGEFVKDTSPSRGGANGNHIILGQFAVSIGRASNRMGGAVPDCVSHIFLAACPPQIFGAIVRSVTVIMGYIKSLFWARPVERLAHQSMNLPAKANAIHNNMARGVAVGVDMGADNLASPSPSSGGYPPNSPVAGNFIIRCSSQKTPLFHRAHLIKSTGERYHRLKRKATELIADYAGKFQAALLAGDWQ